MTTPDYKRIAEEAVAMLCVVGYIGLDPSKRRELWQWALDLDRQLHPSRPKAVVADIERDLIASGVPYEADAPPWRQVPKTAPADNDTERTAS